MTVQKKGSFLDVAIGAVAFIAVGCLVMLFTGYGIIIVLFGVASFLGSFFSCGKQPPAGEKRRKAPPAMSDWDYWDHR